MDKIFLGASVLFSAAYRPGAKFLKLWRMPDVRLVSSVYAADEARRNLDNPEPRKRLERLLQSVNLFSVLPVEALPQGIQLAAKDAPILLAAIGAQATHLLTSDLKHFGPYFYQIIEGVLILPPGAYFKIRSLE